MIISHKHQFIFFAIPKTATHAIREALRTHMGPDDWEQQVLTGQQALPIPALARLVHGHISVQELMPNFPKESFDGYTKFAIVRNPFDRFVSACFFLNRDNPNFNQNPIDNMKGLISRPQFRQRVLILPQWHFLCDAVYKVRMDAVGKYENLQADFNKISEQIGLPETDLALQNASSHDSFAQYYDNELMAMVAHLYKQDFELFDYANTLSLNA